MMAKKKVIAEVLPVDDEAPVLDLVPYFDEKKGVAFDGNFDAVKGYLESWRKQVSTVKFTSKDMDTVMKYKKAAQGYRISLKDFETTVKKKYFNAPKDIFSGMIAELQSIVSDIETKADDVLSEEENKRLADLTQVFDIYKKDFQAEYNLSEAGLARVEYRKSYYNKTAVEADTKKDLEQQFKDIANDERSKALAEKTIRKLCAGNPLLPLQRYLDMIETDDLAIIMDEIEEEENRLAEAVKAKEAKEEIAAIPVTEAEEVDEDESSAVDTEKVVIGVFGAASKALAGGSQFPGRTKAMVADIVYPCDMGPALTVVCKELAKYGIKISKHKEEVF